MRALTRHWPAPRCGAPRLLSWGFLLAAGWAQASSGLPTEADFFSDVPMVLTVSRLAQPLQDTPGAVTVIDRELIRQSGARTLAELMRLVPGYLVSGYNGANPVAAYHVPVDELGTRNLVLVDGRSVYSSTYLGGTVRGLYMVALEDVERIEVLRGSNSAAYGANALFGVINVITRHPQDTIGGTVAVAAGEEGIRDAYARYGWGDADASHRLSVAQRRDNGYRFVNDDARLVTLKWRSDIRLNAQSELVLSAGYADNRAGEGVPSTTPGHFDNPERDVRWRSAYLQARWTYQPSEDESFQGTVSWSEEQAVDDFIYQRPGLQGVVIDFGNRERRLHAEFQHQFRASDSLRWVWGAGLKEDSAVSRPLFFRDSRIRQWDARLFGNVEWSIADDWVLNAGVFAGKNGGTGDYVSPRLMVNYHLLPGHTVRFGVSTAQRAPTLFEQFADVRYFFPNGTFITRTLVSSGQVEPERLVSREISYYGRFPEVNLTVDARLYDERFDREIDTVSTVGLERDFVNTDGFRTQGLEYQLRWQPRPGTQFLWNHNLNRFRWTNPANADRNIPPRQFSTLGWMQELPDDWSLALWVYSRDPMAWRAVTSGLPRDRRVDLRLSRQFRWGDTRAELAFTVHSLNGSRKEFTLSRPSVFPRRAFASLHVEF